MSKGFAVSVDLCKDDAFLELTASAQRLYFFLCMHANKKGFVRAPKAINRMVGGISYDLEMLIEKGFVIADTHEYGVTIARRA